jgi:4-amino-4-deoxy-L-arabinose transferase-like glycosyltransferase
MGFADPASAIGRLRDVLADPARRERTIVVSLALYVLLWTAYGTVAKSAQGLHPDMTEIIAWSRDLSFGYLKHPPLAAWLVWLWFSVFPIADWSYYLLAMLMPAITLWIVWRMSADYLDANKRIVAVALLTFIPFFNFHALKFNVNTVLLPLWAATTWFFLRSVRTHGAAWAALAGVAAAGAMLGKYWSVFLLAGLALAALIDRRRLDYLRSLAPWVTTAAGVIVLAPHLIWLMRHDFDPFSYAMFIHGAKPFGTAFARALGYLAGACGYVAIPVIIVLAVARPSAKTLADIAWPQETERRLAAAAFWGPLLLPALGATLVGAEIISLWSMPAFSLFPVLLLSSPAVTMRAIDTRRILTGVVALPLVMLAVSPVIAIIGQRAGPSPAAAQGRLLTKEVERLWHQATPLSLRYIGGKADLASAVSTYAVDQPRLLQARPQINEAELFELLKSGGAFICFAEDEFCRRIVAEYGQPLQYQQIELRRDYLGVPGRPQWYVVMIMLPQQP